MAEADDFQAGITGSSGCQSRAPDNGNGVYRLEADLNGNFRGTAEMVETDYILLESGSKISRTI